MDPATMMMLATLVTTAAGAASQKGGLFGQKEKKGSTYNKGQLGLIDDVISQIKGQQGGAGDITQNQNYQTGQNWLQGLFNDQDFFNQFEAPLQRQFEENTVPDLANRFASMGSGGSLGSTGFRNQLAREGSNLSTNIAAQRGQMQQNAVPQLAQYAQQPTQNWMQLLQSALTPTQNTYQPASSGLLGGVVPGIVSGYAQGAGNQWGQSMANQNNSGGYGGQPYQAMPSRTYPGQYPGTY